MYIKGSISGSYYFTILFLLLIIIISTCDSHLRRIRDISPSSGIPPNDIDLNSQLPLFSPPTH